MEWFDPAPYIENSSKITAIFGEWPSFHDAWILMLNLSVADGEPWVVGSVSPTLDMLVHVFEMTREVMKEGFLVQRNHTLACFQFRNVEELSLSNFSYQNAIFELIFGIKPMSYKFGGGPAEGPPPNVITVEINSSCGLAGRFKCQTAEVMSVEPCDEFGKALIPSN
jgi:hypothetical protein